MNKTNNVAQYVADFLKDHEVDHVFMLTGGGAMFLNDALSFHEGIKPVFCHHEQACAMAAEGYARVTNKPGVVNVTTGPGGINALNGVFGAFTDSIPLLVISGQVKRETFLATNPCLGLRQLGDQEVDIVNMAKPVCKKVWSLTRPEDVKNVMEEAWRLCQDGRPGPVWIDIPIDVQSSVCESYQGAMRTTDFSRIDLSFREKLNEALVQLNQAKRPLMLWGTGVRLSQTQGVLLEVAEALKIPVATAWCHDTISSDHPLFAGRPGTIGTRQGNFIVQKADCVLVLGSRLNIRQTSYNFATFAKNATIIQVDIDEAEMNKPVPFRRPHVSIKAHLGAAAPYMAGLAKGLECMDRTAWLEEVRAIKKEFPVDEVCLKHEVQQKAVINPYQLIEVVSECWPEGGVTVTGNASACIMPFQMMNVKAGQRLWSNSGAASMGYDLPAAIGACFGTNEPVLCFAGDGSLQMNIQELETVVRYGLNLKVVVIDNGGYLSIKSTQNNFFKRRAGCDRESGVGFPDFTKVAQAYGLKAKTIEYSENWRGELKQALNTKGAMLIHVHVDPEQGFEPRMSSRQLEDGRMMTPELEDMHPFLDRQILSRVMGTHYE